MIKWSVRFTAGPYVIKLAQNAGFPEWKAHLIQQLNLASVDQESNLVMVFWQRPRWNNLRMAMDIGILFRARDGLAFFGQFGSRLLLPYSEIMATGSERLCIAPPRTAVRLTLRPKGDFQFNRGGNEIYIAITEESSFKANRERALQFENEISSRRLST